MAKITQRRAGWHSLGVSLALAARNDMAHASDTIADTDAISYLRSIQAVVEAIDPKSAAGIKALLDDATGLVAI